MLPGLVLGSEFVNQTPGQRLSLPIPEEPAARALRVPPSAYDAGSVLPAPALLVVPTSSPPAPAVLVPGGPVKRPAPAVAPSARRRGASSRGADRASAPSTRPHSAPCAPRARGAAVSRSDCGPAHWRIRSWP